MFDNQNQQLNNNGNKKIKKDINLLPEQLRKSSSVSSVKSPVSQNIKYSKVENVTTEVKSSFNLMERIKSIFGFIKKKNPVLINAQKNDNLVNQPSPLQKLYTQNVSQKQNKIVDNTSNEPVIDLKKNKKNNVADKSNFIKSETTISKMESNPNKKLNNLPSVPSPTTKLSQKEDIKAKQSLSVLDRIDQQLQKGKDLISEKKLNKDEYGVNLIPEEMVLEVDEKKIIKTLILVSVLAIFIIILVWLIIDLVQLRETKQINQLKQEIQIAEKNFFSKSKDLQALLAYQNTYDNIKLLLDNHLYWSGLLDFLEKNVIPEVYFTKISADKNGVIEIDMIADDYYSLAQQYKVFKDSPEVLKINLEGALLNDEDDNLSMIEDMIKKIDQIKNSSSVNSTSTGIISTQKLIYNSYKKMSVKTRMYLYLNKEDLFYQKSNAH